MWLTTRASRLAELPRRSFRFVAHDVKTVNSDRSSACKIGLAGVRSDTSIHTWATYGTPETNNWSCSRIHGITPRDVVGAPDVAGPVPLLDSLQPQSIVYRLSALTRPPFRKRANAIG